LGRRYRQPSLEKSPGGEKILNDYTLFRKEPPGRIEFLV